MPKWAQGIYRPKNLSKYKGNKLPRYRSSWELKLFVFLDKHPDVIAWSSEPYAITYVDPITGRKKQYIPDLLIKYRNKRGKYITELVEVKPKKEAFITEAKTRGDKLKVLINSAKWKAATTWCRSRGIRFRVLTEDDIYGLS